MRGWISAAHGGKLQDSTRRRRSGMKLGYDKVFHKLFFSASIDHPS